MDSSAVNSSAHYAIKGINFLDQSSLGNAAYGRVARHLRDQVQIHGDHGRPQPHTGTRPRRLASRVPRPDHDNIVRLVH
jgi:hypothetical protein